MQKWTKQSNLVQAPSPSSATTTSSAPQSIIQQHMFCPHIIFSSRIINHPHILLSFRNFTFFLFRFSSSPSFAVSSSYIYIINKNHYIALDDEMHSILLSNIE